QRGARETHGALREQRLDEVRVRGRGAELVSPGHLLQTEAALVAGVFLAERRERAHHVPLLVARQRREELAERHRLGGGEQQALEDRAQALGGVRFGGWPLLRLGFDRGLGRRRVFVRVHAQLVLSSMTSREISASHGTARRS